MTKTPNYSLPQWEPADPVQRVDFNDAFAAVDGALVSKGNCMMMTGSYVGTGELGKEHPNRLEFPFKPMILFMDTAENYSLGMHTILTRPITYRYYPGATSYGFELTWEDRAVSWYSNHEKDPGHQMNSLGKTHHYIALGLPE